MGVLMLIEFIELFLGAYYYFIPDDYIDRDWFTSIIVVSAEVGAIVGAILITCICLNAVFKLFRK